MLQVSMHASMKIAFIIRRNIYEFLKINLLSALF